MPPQPPNPSRQSWRREYQVALGAVLMWAGVVVLWLQAGLLDGRLALSGLLFRTLLVLAIWCLARHCLRRSAPDRRPGLTPELRSPSAEPAGVRPG